MPVRLEGGCFVSHARETSATREGTLSCRNIIGKDTGADAISLRILEFSPGLSPGLRLAESDHVLYRLDTDDAGPINVFIDGRGQQVEGQTGIYVRPGQNLTVLNEGSQTAVFITSQCPDTGVEIVDPLTDPIYGESNGHQAIRLSDRPSLPTADRWYRVLVDDELGSSRVTQFVGSIPPGRAPDHFHTYEEVLFILRGKGRMWAGDANTEIEPGSCIFLPKRQVHCVENTGLDELRLLGVFYPAGSPAVRYES